MLKNLFSDVLSPDNLAPYSTLEEINKSLGIFTFYKLPAHWNKKFEPQLNFIAVLLMKEWHNVNTKDFESVSDYLVASWLKKYELDIPDITLSMLINVATYTSDRKYQINLLKCHAITDILNNQIYPKEEICKYIYENTTKEEWIDTPPEYFKAVTMESLIEAHNCYIHTGDKVTLSSLLQTKRYAKMTIEETTDIILTTEYLTEYKDNISQMSYIAGEIVILPALGVTIELDYSVSSSIHIAKVGEVLNIYNATGNVIINVHNPSYIQHCYDKLSETCCITYKNSELTIIDNMWHDRDNLCFDSCKVFCKDPTTKYFKLINSTLEAMEFGPQVITYLAPNVYKDSELSSNKLVADALKTIPEQYEYLFL